MNLRQLRYFLEIAQLRSFTRAAEVLHISQPALSRQIRAIEEELGSAVFTRFDRGVTLTQTGELLRDHATDLLKRFDRLRDDVMVCADEPRGDFSVGMPPSMREMLTVPVLDAYQRKHSSVSLHVHEGISVDLAALVQENKVDCACIIDLSAHAFTRQEPFISEQLYIVGPPDSGLDISVPVPLSYLSNKPMVLTSRPNSLRLVVENALGNARLPLNPVVDGNSTDMMTGLVSRGLAYSILPYCAAWKALRAGTLCAAPIENLRIDWVLLYPSHRGPSVATRKFKETLFDVARSRILSGEWSGASWSRSPLEHDEPIA